MPSQLPLPAPMIGYSVSPDGYCLCGCGERTQIAKRNRHCQGVLTTRRGQYSGYLPGHATRRKQARTPEQLLAIIRASYVVTDAGCWQWTGRKYGDTGYGAFWHDNQERNAHRAHWELVNGPIVPASLVLDHLCRNRICIRLDHLEPVTDWVNIVGRGVGASAINYRKTECIRGHTFTEQNKRIDSQGRRQCRRCDYLRNAVRAARRAGGIPTRVPGHAGKWRVGHGFSCSCGVFLTRTRADQSATLRAHRGEVWKATLAEYECAPDAAAA